MIRTVLVVVYLLTVLNLSAGISEAEPGNRGEAPMAHELTRNIDWLGHATFRIRGSSVVYVDPWRIEGSPHDADLVLVTHSHYDHLSLEDIARVGKPGVKVVAPESTAESWTKRSVIFVSPGQQLDLDGVKIEVVPAYNTDKDFHPKSQRWVGYVVEMDGVRYYHAGDTDLIDEMKEIRCDVAMLPVSGIYVMNARMAVDAAARIGCRAAIPMHWGEIVGKKEDAVWFKDHSPCSVTILERVK